MSKTRVMEFEMWKAGYVSAARAAEMVMVSATGTIYRSIERGSLTGLRSGARWYVTISSLLEQYGENPVLSRRIREWRPAMPKTKAKAKK